MQAKSHRTVDAGKHARYIAVQMMLVQDLKVMYSTMMQGTVAHVTVNNNIACEERSV